VGIDDRLGMLGVCVATSCAALFLKLAASLLSRDVTRMVQRGRLRIVGHVWEGRTVTRIDLREEDFA
jgi:hypothetical protein